MTLEDIEMLKPNPKEQITLGYFLDNIEELCTKETLYKYIEFFMLLTQKQSNANGFGITLLKVLGSSFDQVLDIYIETFKNQLIENLYAKELNTVFYTRNKPATRDTLINVYTYEDGLNFSRKVYMLKSIK